MKNCEQCHIKREENRTNLFFPLGSKNAERDAWKFATIKLVSVDESPKMLVN